MGFKIEIVWPDSQREKREKVFKLRYDAYVRQHGLEIEQDHEILVDKHDEIFPSILLSKSGKALATLRMEISDLGEMEIEGANLHYRNLIPRQGGLSLCRLAIAKDQQGKMLLGKLVSSREAWDVIGLYDLNYIYFASNNPKLFWMYRLVGEVIDKTPRDYLFMGRQKTGYILFRANIGKSKSLKRALYRAYIAFGYPSALKLSRMFLNLTKTFSKSSLPDMT